MKTRLLLLADDEQHLNTVNLVETCYWVGMGVVRVWGAVGFGESRGLGIFTWIFCVAWNSHQPHNSKFVWFSTVQTFWKKKTLQWRYQEKTYILLGNASRTGCSNCDYRVCEDFMIIRLKYAESFWSAYFWVHGLFCSKQWSNRQEEHSN